MNIKDEFVFHMEYDETKSYDWVGEFLHENKIIGKLLIRNHTALQAEIIFKIVGISICHDFPDIIYKAVPIFGLAIDYYNKFKECVIDINIDHYDEVFVIWRNNQWYVKTGEKRGTL